MFARPNKIAVTACLCAFLLTACSGTNAPWYWLPSPENAQKDTYGGFATVTVQDAKGEVKHSGEFIGLRESTVYILRKDSVLESFSMSAISRAVVEAHENLGADAGMETVTGMAFTLTNGLLLIISAPIWLLFGTGLAVTASNLGRYDADEPTPAWWNEVQKFSRFPQGVEGIDLASLHPKPYRRR